ncbi:gamma-glutamylcyclotransferase family protein [Bradyrhizobium sp. CB1015]|uniref:gamma-glutamylcyclotransferase family protein n=1 Tax=Bradyrhizobium sp. CB1015 TaxID=2976822 RepID=UPI0021AA2F27|nr:gamma-glutamylcyclotransferase family protein [Bradyrhizobium sp. CB1015]UWU92915.1 gamma-glutamylcyclotransferase [Bradyrhizobium sp. CB1015]
MPLYFAYGSNMSAATLHRRLQRAPALERRRAILRNYRLAFEKVSSTNPAVGYANVVAAPGYHVEGILNELDHDALAVLDRIELVPHHYRRAQLTVYDCAQRRELSAYVYTAQPSWTRPGLKPLRSYVDGLVQGADLLSADYATSLYEIECHEDVASCPTTHRAQQST